MSTIFNSALVAFLLPFFVGVIVIPLLRVYSEKNRKLVDIAEGDVLKIHKTPTSLLGGLGMVVAIVIGFLFVWVKSDMPTIMVLIAGLLIVAGLGFWDDLKWKHVSTIKPLLKFGLLLVCTFVPAMILVVFDMGFMFIPLPIISVLLSFIYIFVALNAVNYQDGMDGLAGGLVAISLIGFTVLAVITGNYVALMVCMVALGAVAAFLKFNLPPAKIFMGDAGSYALGFIVAAIAMLFSKSYDFLSLLGPLLIIGLPIIDGVYTNIRRLANGKSIFLGDRSHFYDKLMQRGFSVKKTLAICYFLQIVLVVVGVMLYQ